MPDIDLSGESDPTDRMVEQQQQAEDRANDDENHRKPDHDGDVSTDEFDVSEAIENL